jgi:hypothetical protein
VSLDGQSARGTEVSERLAVTSLQRSMSDTGPFTV